MSAQTPPAPASRSAARDRLVTAAAGIFYTDGIHSVGVDRLIAAAGVTKATFYRHFPSKEDLVLAYLRLRDEAIRAEIDRAAAAASDPRGQVASVMEWLAAEVCGPGFRGCPFINAAAEYPEPDHPVRQLVAEHRAWFRETLAGLLRAAGHPAPEAAAASLLLARDGAMVGGYLDGSDARATLLRTADALMAHVGD
ncbi:TetR/AcrR family transcriptional regulator [Streptomyces sp. B1I3]|uniref:TetR/AcrR family transcriptional regulator n=1 Tax=Streptomyces sp. B1I3 TaxID=3042264 RepID=UPI002787A159|nr:TetR/AcrR family transcriptional regulator [Streptomyces sp. B1I3]MDQ0795051.1 AcrR family transcriptional regulator [Streptomyces sp. B1I3]